MEKIKNFTDLEAWKEAHKLVLVVYKLVEKFPSRERFVLSSQMLRSSISVTSNLAEGFGRQGIKEKIRFYYLAKGSLTELQNQLIIARDVKYVSDKIFDFVLEQSVLVQKLVSGLIRSLRKHDS